MAVVKKGCEIHPKMRCKRCGGAMRRQGTRKQNAWTCIECDKYVNLDNNPELKFEEEKL
jgi:hypothetical protein